MAIKLRRIKVGTTTGGNDKMRLLIRCDCNNELVCNGFTNECSCGRDYNFGGSLLADRSQWGEETGESASDILAADTDSAHDDGGPEYQPF
jgi:hypothetical protein